MFITDFEIIILELLTKFDNLFDFFTIKGITFLSWIWWAITQFGDKFIILGVVLLFYWCINKEKGEKIAFSLIISIFINSVLKFFINRDRPFVYNNGKHSAVRKFGNLTSLDGASGTSFPSGHSQNAATLFSSVALNERSHETLLLAIVTITLVPISRVYLGVHYPTDTIVGVLLGLLISYLLYLLMTYCYRQKFIFYIGALVLMTPFLLINPLSESSELIFTAYGLFAGAIIGIIIENKCINFTCNVSVGKKILRFFLGTLILVGCYLVYSLIKGFVPVGLFRNIYKMFGYGTISLMAFGIIPFIFKKDSQN